MAVFLTPINTESDGEKAFAKFLKDNLSDDYLCWHEVSIKSHKKKRERIPDFIVFNPKYGFWILEVKDWSLSYIVGHNPKEFKLADHQEVTNPYKQAEQQGFALINLLRKDSRLMKGGRFIVPVEWGVVFYNITRQEFESPEKSKKFERPGRLGDIPSHKAICADEWKGTEPKGQFERQLISMFGGLGIQHEPFSKQLVTVIRDLIFPDIQIIPDTTMGRSISRKEVQLFDLEQEKVFHQLRLDTGTHILFGVSGSGKTILFLNKARELLESEGVQTPSVLYLCRGKIVALHIQQQAEKVGLPRKSICSFHKWCSDLLKQHEIRLPRNLGAIPTKLIDECRRGNIVLPKYDAILLDEAHDFKDKPQWLELIASMRKSENSLFGIAYDDAQAIYGAEKNISFSLDFLGNETKITKHILRKNYRNTEQILLFAKVLADTFLVDSEHEEIPKVRPIGHGAQGKLPVLIECSSLDDELQKIVAAIQKAHNNGRRWSEIAVLFHTYSFNELENFATKIEHFLNQNGIPCSKNEIDFPKNLVKIMSITKAKGLGIGMVCIAGLSQTEYSQSDREYDVSKRREYLEEDIRYLYNAIMRGLEELVMTYTKPEEGTLSDKRVTKLQIALGKLTLSERMVS